MSWRLSSTKLLSAKWLYFLRSASLATSVTMLCGTYSSSWAHDSPHCTEYPITWAVKNRKL